MNCLKQIQPQSRAPSLLAARWQTQPNDPREQPALLMEHHLLPQTKVTCPLLSTCSADRERSRITPDTILKMTPVQHRCHTGTWGADPSQLCNHRSVSNEILLTWISVVLVPHEGCSRHKMWYWFLRCSSVLSSGPFQKMQSISFLSHLKSHHLYRVEVEALLCHLVFISYLFFFSSSSLHLAVFLSPPWVFIASLALLLAPALISAFSPALLSAFRFWSNFSCLLPVLLSLLSIFLTLTCSPFCGSDSNSSDPVRSTGFQFSFLPFPALLLGCF